MTKDYKQGVKDLMERVKGLKVDIFIGNRVRVLGLDTPKKHSEIYNQALSKVIQQGKELIE